MSIHRGVLRAGSVGVAAACAWLAGHGPASAQPAKPNVIVFMADDMGIGDTSAYLGKKLEAGGAPVPLTVQTPNLERLAQSGALFTDVHTPSSMCSTTRYGLLTGRYAWRSAVKTETIGGWGTSPTIDDQRQTIGNMFQRGGYQTVAITKWHAGVTMRDVNGNRFLPATNNPTLAEFNTVLWPTPGNPNVETLISGPRQLGFDYFFGTLSNNQPLTGAFLGYFENNVLAGGATPTYTSSVVTAPSWDTSKVGETLANKALGVIDQHASGGTKPLFMYYTPLANHGDYVTTTSINLQGQNHLIDNQSRMTNGQDGQKREDLVYENDVVLGALLDKLESTIDPLTGQPMIDNTLIIFTSDNGSDRPSLYPNDAGLRDKKRSIYEGGHRVPFIASWAGRIPQNVVSDQTFGLNDLYATFAELAGVTLNVTEAEDSANILPALLGQSTAQFQRPGLLVNHDDSFVNDIDNGAVLAIRSGDMKLIVSNALVNRPAQPAATAGQSIPVALFDLSADPHEDVNLLTNPAYAGLVHTLRQQLLQYHNQGSSRTTIRHGFGPLLATDGGADLANSVTGAVGYEFTVGASPMLITRLGMWDDGAGDVINQETNAFNPDGDTVGAPDGLATNHWVRLFDKATGTQVANVQVTNANSVIEGEFRYVALPSSVVLFAGRQYALTMSTAASDGDLYHTGVPFSGTAPMGSELLLDFAARQAASDGMYPSLLPNGTTATGAATEDVYDYRFVVGPTATLASIPTSMADFDFDGDADGADLVIWQRSLGMANPTRANGDADLNGVVDRFDLQIWQAAYASTQSMLAAAHAAPEPGAAALAAMALVRLAGRRRRKAPGSWAKPRADFYNSCR